MRALLAIIILCVGAFAQGGMMPGPGTVHSAGGGPTPSIVQTRVSTDNSQPSLAYTTSVTAGNALYAYVSTGSIGTITLNDSQGNTWTTAVQSPLAVDGDDTAVGCAIAGSSAADTITPLFNGTNIGSVWGLVIYEVHNATCTTDGTNAANPSTGTSCSSGSITTTTANDFLMTGCFTSSSSETFTLGAGWSGLQQIPGTVFLGATASQVGTSAGSYTGTFTYNVSSENGSLVVAYKP